jgi:glutaredoxin 3
MSIKVYTKTTCPECTKAKQILQMYGFDYSEVNIEDEPLAREFLVNEGHKSVPQIYVNDTLLTGGASGINKESINQILQG